MGWMDAHEYLVMERTLLDRLDEVERFSLERAFHSEPADEQISADGGGGTVARRPTADGRAWRPAHSC
jgi:hypothetical protein